MEKLCTGCNRTLPATSEYFHKKNGGFVSRCKQCIKAYYQKYYQDNHDEVVERKRIQSNEYYKRHRVRIRNRVQEKYGSRTEWSQNYYTKNRSKILQYRKDYLATEHGWAMQKAHNQTRRAKSKALPVNFSAQEWAQCRQHFNNQCAYCGEEKQLTREHFIPLVRGGEYTRNNIIPACKSCNSKKKQRNFFEWYPQQQFYSKHRERMILAYLNYTSDKTQQLALI